jgi:hypothetical protein
MSRDFKWQDVNEFFNCKAGTVISDVKEGQESRTKRVANPAVEPFNYSEPVLPTLKGKTPFEYVMALEDYHEDKEIYENLKEMDELEAKINREAAEGYDEFDPNDFYYSRKMVRQIGDDVYELAYSKHRDCESHGNTEIWKKNGKLHRYGGFPAHVEYFDPHIPEEAYLSNDIESFYIDGNHIEMSDKTYDSIMSKKSLAVRQSIGYDV